MKFKYLVAILFILVGIGNFLIPKKFIWIYVIFYFVVGWWLYRRYNKRCAADQEMDNWLKDDSPM